MISQKGRSRFDLNPIFEEEERRVTGSEILKKTYIVLFQLLLSTMLIFFLHCKGGLDVIFFKKLEGPKPLCLDVISIPMICTLFFFPILQFIICSYMMLHNEKTGICYNTSLIFYFKNL